MAWHLGTQAGNAVATVLAGDVNPSGKLTATFPSADGQTHMYYDHNDTGKPGREDFFATCKYIDAPIKHLYPFGYGLSYTSFKYDNLKLDKYGQMHKKYIKQNQRAFYSALLIKGTLFDYLEKVDLKAKDELNRLIPLLAKKQGITENLKAENQLKWVGMINNIKSQAEKIADTEIVYSNKIM